jgi:uncharacterized membrane protein
MYAQLILKWDAMRDSFWFLPGMMCIVAAALALLCASLNGPTEQWFVEFAPWVGVSTSAARASLGTIGSAMVSVAGIVFSVMLVTLSITSSQYGSRLLRTFMSDRITQSTLGLLLGTSVFCMLALASIQDSPDRDSPANVSVIVGLLLAVASLAALIGFIHHAASLIQAPQVIAAVARDLDTAIDRLFPDQLGQPETGPDAERLSFDDLSGGRSVPSAHEGYVQAIDGDSLLATARSQHVFLRLRVKPGEFVERQQTLVEAWSWERVCAGPEGEPSTTAADLPEAFCEKVNAAVVTGRRRTPRQDPECALDELVEVAVRALSPGINDPFTAIACVDRLGAAIGRLAERAMPATLRRDKEGTPRLLARPTTFADLLDAAFNQIRQYGCQSVAVAIRLLETLTRIASHVSTEEQRQALLAHAEMLQRDFRRHVEQPKDGDDFQRRYDHLVERVQGRVKTPEAGEKSSASRIPH